MAIQGRRLPKRVAVRSEAQPMNGSVKASTARPASTMTPSVDTLTPTTSL